MPGDISALSVFGDSTRKVVTNRHRIIWKQAHTGSSRHLDAGEKDLIDLSLKIANKKLKHLHPAADIFDVALTVFVDSIFVEYRKEYVEFFISFFQSEGLQDELKFKLMQDYDAFTELMTVQSVLKETREVRKSNFQVSVHLKSSKAFIPIYNTFGPIDVPSNHLQDIS
jgi:hypothetical protein